MVDLPPLVPSTSIFPWVPHRFPPRACLPYKQIYLVTTFAVLLRSPPCICYFLLGKPKEPYLFMLIPRVALPSAFPSLLPFSSLAEVIPRHIAREIEMIGFFSDLSYVSSFFPLAISLLPRTLRLLGRFARRPTHRRDLQGTFC